VSHTPSIEDLHAALETVHDPHVPVSLRRMGMIADLAMDDRGVVRLDLCIPCTACPGVALVEEQARAALMRVDGVSGVVVEAGFHLPWRPEMVEEGARVLMARNGIRI
jgi:ATP-binding protein involved in chromosome partitioning